MMNQLATYVLKQMTAVVNEEKTGVWYRPPFVKQLSIFPNVKNHNRGWSEKPSRQRPTTKAPFVTQSQGGPIASEVKYFDLEKSKASTFQKIEKIMSRNI